MQMREILALGFPPTLLPHPVLIGGVVPSAIATSYVMFG